jgi:hypothetical protein
MGYCHSANLEKIGPVVVTKAKWGERYKWVEVAGYVEGDYSAGAG